MTSEVNGQPGRGIALDVQNRTVVMQMYAYESSGQPTFYLGVGTLDRDDKATLRLTRYTGGRYFGSGPRIGVEAGSPGNVQLRFTNGVSGFARFPGEPEVAISRFNFAYNRVPSSLYGLWSFTSIGDLGLISDAVFLNRNLGPSDWGNGLMVTPDASFGCEHQTRGALAGNVLCVRVNNAGNTVRAYLYAYSVNDGEGIQLNSAGGNTGQLVFVKRLTTPSDDGTGILFKDEPAPVTSFETLRENFNAVASSAEMQ